MLADMVVTLQKEAPRRRMLDDVHTVALVAGLVNPSSYSPLAVQRLNRAPYNWVSHMSNATSFKTQEELCDRCPDHVRVKCICGLHP